MRQDIYFAELEGREYLDALKIKLNTYRSYVGSCGLGPRWALSLGAFYGSSPDGKNSWRVTPGGEFGELVQMKVNDYASYIRRQMSIAVKNRPAGIAKAVNTDVSTLRNARIGTQLVEYFLTDPSHEFEADYVQAMELALLSAESFVVQDWDVTKGSEIRPDERGQFINSGDMVQEVYGIWNSTCDIGAPNAKQPWRIFSGSVNKFELAARFPAYREEILLDGVNGTSIVKPVLFRLDQSSTDFIEVHKLIHLPTLACPKGRYTIFINDQIVLDNAYPYSFKCFHRVSDREVFNTVFGHTSNYDMLALEQYTDTLHSVGLNGLSTFGVATIVGPKGAGLAHQELAKGLRYLELDPNLVDKIRALDLAKLPDMLLPMIQYMGTKKGELSGINGVLMGDLNQVKNLSGSAMALLESQSISVNQGIQTSFYRLLSAAGTGLIEGSRQFADEPKIVRIAGKANSQAVKEFKYDRKTLESVSTVIFEAVNPIMQTAAGKMDFADKMMDRGFAVSAQDYLEAFTTGNLNVITQGPATMKEAILQENEFLAEGKPVQAVAVENHEAHIAGHQVEVSMPNAKQDPNLVARVLAHVQEHTNLWMELSINNPALLIATGQKVLPVQPGMMPPGGPGQPPPEGVPGVPSGAPTQGPNQPNLPKPPVNPMNGERAPVPDGTSIQQ